MYIKIFIWILSILTLNGCGGGGGGTSSGTTSSSGTTTNLALSSDRNITINNAGVQVVRLGKNSIRADINITNGPKDLYILLSNYATTTVSNPQITHNPKIASVTTNKPLYKTVPTSTPTLNIIHAPQEVEAFRKRSQQFLQKPQSSGLKQAKIFNAPSFRQADVVGQVQNFEINQNAGVTTTATAKKVITVNTALGLKTLNIWVSNDSFGAGCLKANCVTQAMVDVLASKFLTSGADNDIYDWVTRIYGAEWGIDAQNLYANVIPYDGNITILLTDIQNDNKTTGSVVLGYFYAKDNYINATFSGSNQRIMFYMDSVLFATPNTGTTWSANDMWPQEMISTLAHEFQHMINYYQKQLKFGAQSQTWLSEMLAETTEDMVATKLKNSGPRHVAYTDGSAGGVFNTGGRYPKFNSNNTLSLTVNTGPLDSQGNPTFSLADYSKVNAFGTFLTRNYGGAKLLHDMVYNNGTGTDAVVQAVQLQPNGAGKTFDDLLREWGVAVLLSDRTNLAVGMPTYNTGAFTADIYNGVQYDLGSINFFNYLPSVNINTTSGAVNPQGNYYYKVGAGLNGLVQLKLLLDGFTEATLIAK